MKISISINTLPGDLFLIVFDFLYARVVVSAGSAARVSRHTNLTSRTAFQIGLFRRVSRYFKDLLDRVYVFDNTQFYSVTSKLAFGFLTSEKTRRGVVSRFKRHVSRGLPVPVHLDLTGLNFKTLMLRPHATVVCVQSISFVGSVFKLPETLRDRLPVKSPHLLSELTVLNHDESVQLIGGRHARFNHGFFAEHQHVPYVPLQVNLIGMTLAGVNLDALRDVHTIILALSTGVTPGQISRFTCARKLSLSNDMADLECVRNLIHLKHLYFRNSPRVDNVDVLYSLSALEYVDGKRSGVAAADWAALQVARPSLAIVQT